MPNLNYLEESAAGRLPERAANRPSLQRLVQIHRALGSGTRPNTSTLARDLEVSTKTIQRDIEFMRERLELPIEYDAQQFGFFYNGEVNRFPLLQITEGELLALVIAEKALQQYRGTSFEKPLLSALRKIEQSLPDTFSLSLDNIQQTISFRTSTEPILELSLFNTLARATTQRRQLAITYRKPGQTQVERRIIDPYHLANINGEWYLFAFDHLRHDIRTFVPSRIKSARQTGKTFLRPEKFSLDKRLRGSFGVHSAEGQYEVLIRFSPRVADYVREKKWHDSQRLGELRDGGVELRLRLSSLQEVERWVLSWAGDALVLKPKELVESVRRAAQRLLQGHA